MLLFKWFDSVQGSCIYSRVSFQALMFPTIEALGQSLGFSIQIMKVLKSKNAYYGNQRNLLKCIRNIPSGSGVLVLGA